MSQENLETASAAIEAWSRRDAETLIALLDPEVEWQPALQMLVGGEAGIYRGHDGVRELMRDTDEFASALVPVVTEYHDLGERIAAVGRLAIRGRESGIEMESPMGVVVDFRQGKILRIRTYLDHAKTLEAAGMAE